MTIKRQVSGTTRIWMAVAVAGLAIGGTGQAAPSDRKTPYWASISAGQARLRTGPGRNFPASWLYRRADLPIKVIEVYPSWRKIVDPDGTVGWMQATLLSEQRTAIVTGGVRPLRTAPDPRAPIAWRAEPGVVGRISDCSGGWCRIDVHGQSGFVETAHLWGLDPNETVD
jgi:SH3-like domain-containing protein